MIVFEKVWVLYLCYYIVFDFILGGYILFILYVLDFLVFLEGIKN